MVKRTPRKDKFLQVSNELLEDPRMSFQTKGLLCWMLSKPDNWVYHKSMIVKNFEIGRKAVNNCFEEMEAAGYLVSVDHLRKHGKFDGKAYILYDEPQNLTDVSLGTSVHRQRLRDVGGDTTNNTIYK